MGLNLTELTLMVIIIVIVINYHIYTAIILTFNVLMSVIFNHVPFIFSTISLSKNVH